MTFKTFTDQLSREVTFNFPPKRIISLVPSQTELLFDLGLDAEITGITKFCHHPKEKARTKTKIGGTKSLDLELIRSLKADLIISNKEENERAQIESLMADYPVWISDIDDLPGALEMISDIGALVNKQTEADNIAGKIAFAFASIPKLLQPFTVAYFIWQKPYMAAGEGTFIDDMLQRCGFANAISDDRYPVIEEADLISTKADVVMLSSEPFPFKQKHLYTFKARMPKSEVILVDGEMFSWYGSRLLQSASYFEALIKDLNKLNS